MPLCENTKIEIATNIARDSEVSIARYMPILNIQDENERMKIAMMEIARKSEYVMEFLKLYNVQSKEIDILKDIAIIDKDISMIFMIEMVYQRNKLRDLKSWVDIVSQIMSHVCMEENFNEVLQNIDYMLSQLGQDYPREATGKFKHEINTMDITLKFLQGLCASEYKQLETLKQMYIVNFQIDTILGEKNLDKILNQLDNISNPILQKKLIKLTNFVFFVLKNNQSVVAKNPQLATKLICELISLRSEVLKLKLLPYVIYMITQDKLDIIKREDELKPKTWSCFYSIIFYKYGLYEKKNCELLNQVRSVVYSSRIKKNAILTQNILDKLLLLNNVALTNQERVDIIGFLCQNKADLEKNLVCLYQAIMFKKDGKLSKIKPDSRIDILENMSASVYGQLGINNDDKDYIRKFHECMYDNMDRKLGQYICLYITRNMECYDMKPILKTFINAVASKDRMREERYNTLNIEHLAKLKELNNKVFKKWISEYSQNGEVQITDDAIDLFLIGTEISGSCQNIESVGGTLNKCLMGYVMDGKNKACVIKDGNGRIMARCIIRLLIDEKTKKAVMVKEPLYCIANDKILETSDSKLRDKCIEYAKWLGVALVESEQDGNKTYPNTLISVGSNAPYEYVDSARSFFRQGFYEVNDVSYIQE